MSHDRGTCDSEDDEVRLYNQEPSDRVSALVDGWRLWLEEPFPETPGSPGTFVAGVRRADGTPCVLKVSPHLEETRSEIAALALWGGDGAARLLESAPELGGMLSRADRAQHHARKYAGSR